ncbi:MAG: hypothetical protein HUU18_10020 [Phycisphaerales bacterium]|nr:hypothetical protein [Phycisphaerales bacterium]
MVRNLFAAAAVVGLAGSALASVTLNAAITADDYFTAFISTSPTLQGVSFLSAENYFINHFGSAVLPEAGTYYLHVIAGDRGNQRMFIGDFTLDSPDATFLNGTQSLLTNTADWSVSSEGLGLNMVQPVVQPSGWGAPGPGISPNASYLWHPQQPTIAYFSTPITVVPAPGYLAAGLLGLATLARRSRR